MERFSAVKVDPGRTPQMASIQNWVERFICGTNRSQLVVSNRKEEFGSPVTQLMFENKNRWAQVCPFVRDSLDYDLFGIEESSLDGRHPEAFENLLKQQIRVFLEFPPRHDPIATGKAAELPVLWKTFLTFFPRIKRTSKGAFDLFDKLHDKLKPIFIEAGLMLGQFYAGCAVAAVYNPLWKGPLVSPYPAFAIRYMAKHDKLFISQHSPEYEQYKKFFPVGSEN